MRKLMLLIISLMLALSLLSACGEGEAFTPSASSGTTSSSGEINETVDLPTVNENIIFTTLDTEIGYYPSIDRWYSKNSIDFPNEDGWFFKIITSLEELDELMIIPNIEPEVFENSYLVCMSCATFQYNLEPTYIGYYGLKCENGEYSIICDTYTGYAGASDIMEGAISSEKTVFFAVPRDEFSYVEGIQRITVVKNEVGKETVKALKPNTEATLPSKSQILIIGSENEFGIAPEESLFDQSGKAAVLYLSTKFDGDFTVTSTKVVNGDLFIEINNYLDAENSYTRENSFFQLNNVPVSKLRKDYKVYINVRSVAPPDVAATEVSFEEKDAIWRAQKHFVTKYAAELPQGCFYDTNITESQDNRFWYVTIVVQKELEDGTIEAVEGERYRYTIEKSTLEIFAYSKS